MKPVTENVIQDVRGVHEHHHQPGVRNDKPIQSTWHAKSR